MSSNSFLFRVCVCLVLASTCRAQDDPVASLSAASQGLVGLSRIIQCLAEKGDNAEYTAEVYHVLDGTVAGIKKNVDGPLTAEKFNTLLNILVFDSYALFKVIDPQCNGYCPSDSSDYSHAPKEIGEVGASLEALGLIMSCMLDDPTPENIGQLPVVVGAGMQAIAVDNDTSRTSVGMLLVEVNRAVEKLEKLFSKCANIKRVC